MSFDSSNKNESLWTHQQKFHPLRERLTEEVHARPFESINDEVDVFLFVKVTGEGASEREFTHLRTFCNEQQIVPPPLGTRHFSAELNDFRVRWERHGEFTTYMAIIPTSGALPFSESVPDVVSHWISSTEGQIIVATHLSARYAADAANAIDYVEDKFVAESLVSAKVARGDGQVWTDLQIHDSGFNHIFLINTNLKGMRLGRIIQRLLDVSTYRNMALLALPEAQKAGGEIAQLEKNLSKLLDQIQDSNQLATKGKKANQSIVSDSEMLQEVTDISMKLQRITAKTKYRFSAADAYFELVKTRITDLGEQQVDGYQTIGEFLQRRMTPAMRTCHSVHNRLDDLSNRTSRAVDLLRTRLNSILEKQNYQLLESMSKRARVQMRMQETVEGLSIAAITYYLVGLIAYLVKSIDKSYLPISPETIIGISVVPTALLVWFGIRKMKQKVLGKDKSITHI